MQWFVCVRSPSFLPDDPVRRPVEIAQPAATIKPRAAAESSDSANSARVHGNQDLAIDFTTGQLNDVWKSLTVVDLGHGQIGSVRYNSIAPLDERLLWPRQVVVEYPAQEGWKLVDSGPKAEESTPSFHRFRVNVAPDSAAELKVEAFHPLESDFALTNLNQHEVELLTEQQRLTPAMREAFQKVLAKKNEIGDLDTHGRSISPEGEYESAEGQCRGESPVAALHSTARSGRRPLVGPQEQVRGAEDEARGG